MRLHDRFRILPFVIILTPFALTPLDSEARPILSSPESECGGMCGAPALPGNLAGFTLNGALNYGVLVEPGASSFQLSNSTIAGNVGIGSGLGAVLIAGNGLISPIPGQAGTGRLDLAGASAGVSNTGNIAGGVLLGQSPVTTAFNLINALGSTLGTEVGTALTISGGGQVVNASSGTLDAGGNRVFTVVSNGFNNNSGGFTIAGTASDSVVININNGTSNEALGGPISLTGGITADHVLFNFTGTSGTLTSSVGGATVNGIILAPNMSIDLDNMTLDGRIIGGQAGQDFQLVSGFHLNQPTALGPGSGPTQAAPEPITLLLSLGGLGLLLCGRLLSSALRRAA
jgi:hypothetical protein